MDGARATTSCQHQCLLWLFILASGYGDVKYFLDYIPIFKFYIDNNI